MQLPRYTVIRSECFPTTKHQASSITTSKRPRRSTLQTTAYTEPDEQPQIETVRVSDDSSDEYQTSRRSDQTESDTEPDAEDNDFPDDDTAPGTGRRS